jgi:hypothetical protein
MADANSAQAINQVKCIVGMCDFFDNPSIRRAIDQSVPVSMPPEAGALGFDIPLWVGLGMVGLWAALDAHAERAGLQSKCSTCGRKCIVAAYTTKLQGAERQAFAELEDLRHLYAHNYAGVADEKYFDRRSRHVLKTRRSRGIDRRRDIRWVASVPKGWQHSTGPHSFEPEIPSFEPAIRSQPERPSEVRACGAKRARALSVRDVQ